MRPTTTPLLLLCLAISVTAAATPPAFAVPLPGRRRPYQDRQPLLFRQPSRGVIVLWSSSSPQKEDVSKMEAAKPGPGEQSMSLTTANTTAAAFDLLVDMKNWATVLEDRQELSKEEIIDRLDEWGHRVNGDQRIVRAALEKLDKDVNRVAILLVIYFGVSLATIAPAWFAAK